MYFDVHRMFVVYIGVFSLVVGDGFLIILGIRLRKGLA